MMPYRTKLKKIKYTKKVYKVKNVKKKNIMRKRDLCFLLFFFYNYQIKKKQKNVKKNFYKIYF